VLGTLLSLKHELRVMQAQGHGSIINISSTFGHEGAADAAVYAASKHAVEGLTAYFEPQALLENLGIAHGLGRRLSSLLAPIPRTCDMTEYTHQTAPTQFVEANGIRFAYRRFGKASGVPIVFNQHYLGTMDYWDPAVTDGVARDREVILFNNAGVSSSSGEVPTTFEQMGTNAVAFSRAIGLNKVDVLGFSIGGMVAQEITLQAPDLVRKLILVGTGPRGGQGMASLTRSTADLRCRL
jgi:short chain dehydrogenase/alpha/beta hydrolase fold